MDGDRAKYGAMLLILLQCGVQIGVIDHIDGLDWKKVEFRETGSGRKLHVC